ncbi:AAA family ATPase [Mesorhizobium album]|uniref:AAA family ATPase n=1 Tax=Mesorhizobium album TaxID=3072314 RepID=UPI003D3243DE
MATETSTFPFFASFPKSTELRAPGSGKTTLIEALKAAGLATAPEAGRRIIRD